MRLLALKLLLFLAAHPAGHLHRQHERHKLHWQSAVASVYGPGTGDSSSSMTACGKRLSPGTVGVANRWLPCGRLLRFAYHGHRSYARVVDRGPYVAGRDYDLTNALRVRLHFPLGVDALRVAVVGR